MKPKEKIIRLISISLMLSLMALTFNACRTPAGRTTGAVVDDATITSTVKGKLLKDNILRGIAVGVDTFQGEVTLTGAVDTKEQMNRAEDLAKEVYGVKKVNNHLMLKKQ